MNVHFSYRLRDLLLITTLVCIAFGIAIYMNGPSRDEIDARARSTAFIELQRQLTSSRDWKFSDTTSFDWASLKCWPHSEMYRYYGLAAGDVRSLQHDREMKFTITSASVNLSRDETEGDTSGGGEEMPSSNLFYTRNLTDIGIGFRQPQRDMNFKMTLRKEISVDCKGEVIPVCYCEYVPRSQSERSLHRAYFGWMINGKWQLAPQRYSQNFLWELRQFCEACGDAVPDRQDFLCVSVSFDDDEMSSDMEIELVGAFFGWIADNARHAQTLDTQACLDRYLAKLSGTQTTDSEAINEQGQL